MVKPIRNNVLVRAFKGSDKSAGGIFIPDHLIKDSAKVEIVEVGGGTPKKPMTLKKGDIGYRVKDWGTEIIDDDGQKYYLMNQDAIIALD